MSKIIVNFPNTVILIALLYGFSFAGILVFRNRKKKNVHFWLGVFLLVFSNVLFDTYLKLINLDKVFPAIRWTYYRLTTLIPYTLWIYISVLVMGKFKIQRFEKLILTFVIFEAVFRVYMFLVFAIGWNELGLFLDYTVDNWLEVSIILISMLTMTKSLQLVRSYQQKLANNYSEKSERELKWLKELLLILLLVIIAWIVIVPINLIFSNINIPSYWLFILQALIIFYLVLKGQLQPEIFHEFPLVPSYETNIIEEKNAMSEETQKVSENKKLKLQITLIEKAIQIDKIYRQPKLTLQDMAKKLNLPTRQLSNLINRHYECSFSDFINQHRVEEIKKRILAKDDEKFTLLAMALEAGFNSKSSFNYMFKKFTNQTPRQFKNSIKS